MLRRALLFSTFELLVSLDLAVVTCALESFRLGKVGLLVTIAAVTFFNGIQFQAIVF